MILSANPACGVTTIRRMEILDGSDFGLLPRVTEGSTPQQYSMHTTSKPDDKTPTFWKQYIERIRRKKEAENDSYEQRLRESQFRGSNGLREFGDSNVILKRF